MTKLVIAGYYGFGNTGDEAILSGLISDLARTLPDIEYTVLSGNPYQTYNWHGVDAIHWTDLDRIQAAVAGSDLVILGGGGILHDSHHFILDPSHVLTPHFAGLSYYASIPLLAYLNDVPCVMTAVGVGPLESAAARQLSSVIFDLCVQSTVRDMQSLDFIDDELDVSKGIRSRISLAADLAFLHEFETLVEESSGVRAFEVSEGRLLGVSLRHWDFGQPQDVWERETAAALDRLVIEEGYHILLIPFQVLEETVYENDEQVCQRVLENMKEQGSAQMLDEVEGFRTAIDAVRQCDSVLGMRYHSVLFALRAGIPVVGLGYDAKVLNLLNEFEMQEHLLEQPWTQEAIFSAVKAVSNVEKKVVPQKVLWEVQQRAHSSIEMVAELLQAPARQVSPADAFTKSLLMERNQAYLDLQAQLLVVPSIKQTLERKEARLAEIENELTAKADQLASANEQLDLSRNELNGLNQILEGQRKQIDDFTGQLAEQRSLNEDLAAQQEDLLRTLSDLEETLHKTSSREAILEQKVLSQEKELADRAQLEQDRDRLSQDLYDIHRSRYWRILGVYWRARERIKRLWKGIRHPSLMAKARKLPDRIRLKTRQSRAEHVVETPKKSAGSGLKLEIRKQPDVIVLPIIDWEFRFQRPQQLARQFALNGQRVFYTSTTFTAGSMLKNELEQNVFQIDLPGPALNIYRDAMSEEDAEQILNGLEQLAFEMGIKEAVCMIQLPFWTPLGLKLRSRFGWKIVYDCMDDHSGFSTNKPEMLGQEEMLLSECDLALATSRILLERCEAAAPKTLFLPNAVDFEHFTKAEGERRPADMPETSGPIIGYVGAISDWFDFDLLLPAVEAHPEWTFVFVGSTWGADQHRALARRSNVHFLGEKPYAEIPGYLNCFDCCVIPFKENKLTRATNPVKLYEYLAAGKPVVARRLPELEEFENYIELAESGEQFLAGLERALQEVSPEKVSARIDKVRTHTWQARFETLQDALDDVFGKTSVVIVTWNNLNLTRQCLDSLLRSTSHPDLEFIIVDNASEDGTQDVLKDYAEADGRFHLILNETNRGFGAALNQGFDAAVGDTIAVLNNDVMLTPGWLSVLTARLHQDSSIGMIGPVSNGAWNEALVEGEYSSDQEMFGFAWNRASGFSGKTAPIKMLAMYCIVLRKQVLDTTGFMDENYHVGMFEDDDFALRMKQAGYRMAVALDVFIHHDSKSSFKLISQQKYKRIFSENRDYFEKKWSTTWQAHVSTDLLPVLREYQKLKNLLDTHHCGERVILAAGVSPEEKELYSHYLKAFSILTQKDAVVFILDADREEWGIEPVSDKVFVINTPAPALDCIHSPLIFTGVQNRHLFLNLRAPRLVYDLRMNDSGEVDNEPGTRRHEALINEAEVVLVGSEHEYAEMKDKHPQVFALSSDSTEDHRLQNLFELLSL